MEAAAAAELPSAHISHLHRARSFHTGGPWSVYGKRHDSPRKYGSVFCSRIYPCVCTCCPEGCAANTGRICKTLVCMGGCVCYEEYFLLFTLRRLFFFFFFFLKKRHTVLFGCLLAVWPCVMINFNGPSTTSPGNVAEQNGRYPLWKAPDRESEGWRWRDRAFRKCCFHEA